MNRLVHFTLHSALVLASIEASASPASTTPAASIAATCVEKCIATAATWVSSATCVESGAYCCVPTGAE
jgi:hypothetical protein